VAKDGRTDRSIDILTNSRFGRPFVILFALSYWTIVCPPVLSVCDVGVMWRKGWMDQDEVWHAGASSGHTVLDRYQLPYPHGKGHNSPHFRNLRAPALRASI